MEWRELTGTEHPKRNKCSICNEISDRVRRLIEMKPGIYICTECATASIERFSQQGVYVRVTRSIEFPEEHYQAGVSILSYFGTVLREKYSHLDAKVRIEQEDLKVTLVVESSNGEREEIEQALNEYNLLVQGNMLPEEFYSNPIKALELKQQLSMMRLQLENQREINMLSQRLYEGQIQTLADEMKQLHIYVGRLLEHRG